MSDFVDASDRSNVESHDLVILHWEQWNHFTGSVRSTGREALALAELLAPNKMVKSMAVYTVNHAGLADRDLLRINATALRELRSPKGEGEDS